MATAPRLMAAPTWAIRSIPVRSRDGPERLDQAYRRLLSDAPCDRPPADGPRSPSTMPAPSRVPDPRR
jgi:hypothetical protein